MCKEIRAFVASAAEAFRLRGPVYRFVCGFGGDLQRRRVLPNNLDEFGCVDVQICDAAESPRCAFPDGAARTALCFGTLEFAFEPQHLVAEMTRILAPGGALLIATSPQPPAPKAMPGYWRLTPRSVERLLGGAAATIVGYRAAEALPQRIYGIGFKPPLDAAVTRGIKCFLRDFQTRLDKLAGQHGRRQRLKRLLAPWMRRGHKLDFTVHLCVERNCRHELLKDYLDDQPTGGRIDLTE